MPGYAIQRRNWCSWRIISSPPASNDFPSEIQNHQRTSTVYMKTLITLITITAALTLPSTGARPRLIPPNRDIQSAVEETAATPAADAEESLDKAKEQLDAAQVQIEKQLAEAEAQVAQTEAQTTVAAAAAADA